MFQLLVLCHFLLTKIMTLIQDCCHSAGCPDLRLGNSNVFRCQSCHTPYHRKCIDRFSNPVFSQMRKNWKCVSCTHQPNDQSIDVALPNSSALDIDYVPVPVATLSPHQCISKFKKGFIFSFVNINGVRKSFSEFRHFAISNPNLSVIGIAESKLSDASSLQNVEIDIFNFIRSDRERMGGGLILYYSSRFAVSGFNLHVKFSFETEIISTKFYSKGIKPIISILIYRPPHGKIDAFLHSLAQLLPLLHATGFEVVIFGDLNIDLLPGHSTPASHSLLHLFREFGFAQTVKGPTHSTITSAGMSFSLIDHFYTNRPKLYIHSDHFPAFGSRHDFVFSVRKKLKEKCPPVQITFRCLRKIDWDTFKSQIPPADRFLVPRSSKPRFLQQCDTLSS